MAQFTSDGLSLAYDEFGPRDAKKAIVLVHGFSANRYENWNAATMPSPPACAAC